MVWFITCLINLFLTENTRSYYPLKNFLQTDFFCTTDYKVFSYDLSFGFNNSQHLKVSDVENSVLDVFRNVPRSSTMVSKDF